MTHAAEQARAGAEAEGAAEPERCRDFMRGEATGPRLPEEAGDISSEEVCVFLCVKRILIFAFHMRFIISNYKNKTHHYHDLKGPGQMRKS